MFLFLGKLFGKGSNRSPQRRPSARLRLEALEQRDVPTIVFMPHLGVETLTSSATNDAMPHPNVNLVFSGSYWTTAQGQQDQATLVNSARNILTGPYLGGLIQYGSAGYANLANSWDEALTVTRGRSDPSGFAVQNLLQNSITKHHLNLGFNTWQYAPIYIVVSDPTSAGGYNGGWNGQGTFTYSVYSKAYREWIDYPENMRMIWMGTSSVGGHIAKDAFTMTFSHEMAETISDPDSHGIWLNKGSKEPLDMGHQISDNEPELGWVHYGYRLGGTGGDLVQAYWSVRDQAYIVPDGRSQTFTLYPVWDDTKLTTSTPGAGFVGVYDLNVIGDQFGANFADNVQILDGGLSNPTVKLNGESATFEPGSIRTLSVNTAGGSNAVQVFGVGAGVTVNLDSSGTNSSDTVTVGANGSLAGIQGTVNVSNHSGHTALVVNGSADAAQTVTVTDHSLAFSNLPSMHLNYDAAYVGGDSLFHGVRSLTLSAAPGSLIDVESVGALTDTYLYWYAGLTGLPGQPGLLRGPAAGKVHLIYPQTKNA